MQTSRGRCSGSTARTRASRASRRARPASAWCSCPRTPRRRRRAARSSTRTAIVAEGLTVLGWREVPVNKEVGSHGQGDGARHRADPRRRRRGGRPRAQALRRAKARREEVRGARRRDARHRGELLRLHHVRPHRSCTRACFDPPSSASSTRISRTPTSRRSSASTTGASPPTPSPSGRSRSRCGSSATTARSTPCRVTSTGWRPERLT